MRRLILPLALAATAAIALYGCGQKGPLTFPPPVGPGMTAKPQTPHPAPVAPAAAAAPAVASTVAPAAASTVEGPARASSTMTPFNPIIHQ
ncbi:MAG: lipoprotein [Luteibacter sp.]|jgi:predicted small lipoprotein YifL